MIQKLTDEEYKTAYGLVPRLCVDLAIRREDGAVLLVKRLEKPEIGTWHFPGGRVAIREPICGAASRIALREIGVDVSIIGICNWLEFLHDVGDLGDFHSVSLLLNAKLKEQKALGSDCDWFTAMPERVLSGHEKALKEIMTGGYEKL